MKNGNRNARLIEQTNSEPFERKQEKQEERKKKKERENHYSQS